MHGLVTPVELFDRCGVGGFDKNDIKGKGIWEECEKPQAGGFIVNSRKQCTYDEFSQEIEKDNRVLLHKDEEHNDHQFSQIQ
ncbi:hypothetical protein SDJN03_03341, partial [Cucurbita argyrosperma subsp. sororia]